jgi:hypothetical protein
LPAAPPLPPAVAPEKENPTEPLPVPLPTPELFGELRGDVMASDRVELSAPVDAAEMTLGKAAARGGSPCLLTPRARGVQQCKILHMPATWPYAKTRKASALHNMTHRPPCERPYVHIAVMCSVFHQTTQTGNFSDLRDRFC